jgi:LysR family hydrogen peroxide-inducible transcriptional activator
MNNRFHVSRALGSPLTCPLPVGHCLRDQALQFCDMPREDARRTLGATSLTTIMQMVAAGYGVTLLPRLCADVEVKDDRIALVGFDGESPKRIIGLAWRKSSPRRRDFLAFHAAILAARQSGHGRSGMTS